MSVSVSAVDRVGSADERPEETARSPRYRANPNVVAQRMGGDVVLVHLRTNQICELTSTSARAWELLTNGVDKDGVIASLESEFDVGSAQLRAELDDFLAVLADRELIDAHDDR